MLTHNYDVLIKVCSVVIKLVIIMMALLKGFFLQTVISICLKELLTRSSQKNLSTSTNN